MNVHEENTTINTCILLHCDEVWRRQLGIATLAIISNERPFVIFLAIAVLACAWAVRTHYIVQSCNIQVVVKYTIEMMASPRLHSAASAAHTFGHQIPSRDVRFVLGETTAREAPHKPQLVGVVLAADAG